MSDSRPSLTTPSLVQACIRLLADGVEDCGYYVILPVTLEGIRQALAEAGAIGELVTIRVVCPVCQWRKEWQQYEREPGRFDGLCPNDGARCVGDSPTVVRS